MGGVIVGFARVVWVSGKANHIDGFRVSGGVGEFRGSPGADLGGVGTATLNLTVVGGGRIFAMVIVV